MNALATTGEGIFIRLRDVSEISIHMADAPVNSWTTCPRCDRRLRSPKAWHYCARVDVATLFEKKDPVVKQLYDLLRKEVMQWGDIEASGTKNCIVFTGTHTFLVAKPMKKALDLHFSLPDAHDAFPVYKCDQYGGKFVHYIRLHDADDLDGDALGLMHLAYVTNPDGSSREPSGE